MSKLSKDAVQKKGQEFLKGSKKDACLVAEDGTVFLPENQRYADSHGRTLQAKGEGYSGAITEVKAGKAAKTEAKAEEAPEAPKEAPKKGKKAKK